MAQQLNDSPMQQFVAINHVEPPNPSYSATSENKWTDNISHLLQGAGLTDEMKLEIFAMDRNHILLRVENIGDIFNSQGQLTYSEVNIKDLVEGLYRQVNGDSAKFAYTVAERSLNNNDDYEHMS